MAVRSYLHAHAAAIRVQQQSHYLNFHLAQRNSVFSCSCYYSWAEWKSNRWFQQTRTEAWWHTDFLSKPIMNLHFFFKIISDKIIDRSKIADEVEITMAMKYTATMMLFLTPSLYLLVTDVMLSQWKGLWCWCSVLVVHSLHCSVIMYTQQSQLLYSRV